LTIALCSGAMRREKPLIDIAKVQNGSVK